MSDDAFLEELTTDLPRENLNALTSRMGLQPTTPGWLLVSLVHRSFAGDTGTRPVPKNLFSVAGMLQGLGSSLLELALYDYAYFQRELRNPKQAADFTAGMKTPILIGFAGALGLPSNALVGKSLSGEVELATAVRVVALQVIGGLYRSEGYMRVLTLIHSAAPEAQRQLGTSEASQDFKSLLQEYAQSIRCGAPQYSLLEESGPQHAKEFHARVTLKSTVSAEGVVPSLRAPRFDIARRGNGKRTLRNPSPK